jgi:hypothetical protein
MFRSWEQSAYVNEPYRNIANALDPGDRVFGLIGVVECVEKLHLDHDLICAEIHSTDALTML